MATLSQLLVNGKPYIFVDGTDGTPTIEPLGGYQTVDDVLDRFPDTVYNLNQDTHLYALLTALCGDSGAGSLKKDAYIARLSNEGNLITFTDLDGLYAHTLQFPRLPDEIYQLDPTTSVLTTLEWDSIHLADEKYQNRAKQFLQATRLGNSPAGMVLGASSATGLVCDVIENYKALFDAVSDDVLGIDYVGQTNSPYEFIVLTRLDPFDPRTYTTQPSIKPVNTHSAPTFVPGAVYNLNDIIAPITVNGHFYEVTVAGTADVVEPTWPTDGTTVVSNTVTFEDIGLSTLGESTIFNGTTTGQYLVPSVQRNLVTVLDTMRPVGTLMSVNIAEEHFIPIVENDGVTPVIPIVDASSMAYSLSRFVTGSPSVNWPSPDSQVASGSIWQPSTTYTIGDIVSPTVPNGHFYQVTAVTGDQTSDIVEPTWPTSGGSVLNNNVTFTDQGSGNRSTGNFIIAGVETEQNTLPLNQKSKGVIFHTLAQAHGYTDAALNDATYGTADFYGTMSNYTKYISQHIGVFPTTIASLFPFLQNMPKTTIFEPNDAIAAQNTPINFESRPGQT